MSGAGANNATKPQAKNNEAGAANLTFAGRRPPSVRFSSLGEAKLTVSRMPDPSTAGFASLCEAKLDSMPGEVANVRFAAAATPHRGIWNSRISLRRCLRIDILLPRIEQREQLAHHGRML